MTRYQRAKRFHTWISAFIAMSAFGLFIVLLGAAEWMTG